MDSRLFWLALAAFAGATEGGLIVGLVPTISEEMRVTMGEAGLIVSAAALSYGFGAPLLAVVLGGVGRRRVLAGAVLTLALAAVLFATAQFFLWMVVARMLLAMAAGTFAGTAMAVAAAVAGPGQRGRAMQTITLGQSIASLIGVPAAAFVATQIDWRIPYWLIAGIAAAAALALYLKLPRGMHGDTQTMADRVRVMKNPGVVPALVASLLLFLATNLPWIYAGAVAVHAGLDKDFLPYLLLANGIGAVAASTSFGRLSDRFGNGRTVMVSMLVQVAILLGIIALPYLPIETRAISMFTLYVVFGYFGWGFWIAHCSQMAHLAPTSVPLAISLDMSALSVGVAIAGAAGGYVVDHWGAGMLAVVGLPIALVAIAVWQAMSHPAPGAATSD
jgi:predicted MFS family arabinose efflux permease